MTLELSIRNQIDAECSKHIARHHEYHNHLHVDWERNSKRVAGFPEKFVKIPDYWKIDRKFNPFYVRSNSAAIARSISEKIVNGSYAPHTPHLKKIPKANGGQRELTIFQIPDAAVSKYFYQRLLEKNKHRFSSFSYAYRNDRNVHFAIQDIAVDLANDARTFIAEFDFSDFFGSIDHTYLFEQLDRNGFLLGMRTIRWCELSCPHVIGAFLKEHQFLCF